MGTTIGDATIVIIGDATMGIIPIGVIRHINIVTDIKPINIVITDIRRINAIIAVAEDALVIEEGGMVRITLRI
jgi:hypothetical protein